MSAGDGPSAGRAIAPMGVPAGAPLVIIVGGSFDPPHVGHVALACAARGALEGAYGCAGLGWLVYVPVARSPHKAAAPIGSDADRVSMVRLAVRGVARAAVWTDEVDRSGEDPSAPSYTVETLGRARAWLDANGCASSVMRLMIGADQARAFHRWREPRRIVSMAEPVVLLRSPDVTVGRLIDDMRATGAWSEAELAGWAGRVVEVGAVDVSATEARGLLRDPGQNRERLAEMLDPRVLEYAVANHLYE